MNPKWKCPDVPVNELFAHLWMQAGCPRKMIVKIQGQPVTLIDGLPSQEVSMVKPEEKSRPGLVQTKGTVSQ